MARYWQGLNTDEWRKWFIRYEGNLLTTHDRLYKSTQRAGRGSYFKSGEIKYRPLIIWFAYSDSSISKPEVIKSSGSVKYDNFNCNVIKNTRVPVFPTSQKKVFMWDGNIREVVRYLKYRGVMPVNYRLGQRISPSMINWNRM